MGRNVKEKEYEQLIDNTIIVPVRVIDEMKKSFISYAMAVNVSRAIPDVRDGLKPVHRRILYAMSELGLYSDKPYRKCARIVGDVLGKYHPHGDGAVYDALVRMAQDFSIRCTLVDGHGNFGSVDGDPAAAQRYTEAKLSKIASEILRDIDKNTVDFYPNFDDTLQQPTVMPSRYPNLLVNGADGIAVGMATSIPPHNLREVIDGTLALLNNPDIEVDELCEHIPAPDFPTGAIVLGRAAIRQAYRTGRGGCIIRARAEIEDVGNRSRIVITELPYQVNKAKLIETMADLVKNKKLEGISDIKEESDRKGMRVVIDIKRDANAQVVLNSLYKHTNLQTNFSMILLALVNGVPKIVNLKEILESYIIHQKDVIFRRTKYDYEKAAEKHHILLGLVIALEEIDKVIALIKNSKDKSEAQAALIEHYGLSEKQSNAILEMRLQRLTALEVDKLKEELTSIENLMVYLKDIIDNPIRVIEVIKEELTEIRDRYSDDRRSEISYDYSEINIADLIEKEDVVVSLSHEGYVKKMPVAEYRSQRRGGRGITAHKTKEEDFVEKLFTTSTHSDLLFFTNKGRVYSVKCYEVPDSSRSARGRNVVNLIQLENDEKVKVLMPLDENPTGNLILATKNGLIKKTDLTEFKRINRNGKYAIKLVEGDELIAAELTSGNDELIMASSSGLCIRFNEQHVRQMGRVSQGVKSMKLKPDERIVDMAVIQEGAEICTITENGYGKRTSLEHYRLQSRAGRGIKAGNFTEKTGALVSMKLVTDDDDIMIITNSGTIIRTSASSISLIGRGSTQGVKVMRVDENCKVVSVAVTPHIEIEEEKIAEEGEISAVVSNNTTDTDTVIGDNQVNADTDTQYDADKADTTTQENLADADDTDTTN